MTDEKLRDTFATAAMQSLLAGDVRSAVLLAADAYKVADAMLIERARNNTPTTTLTDEEQDSLKFAINQMKYIRADSAAATLRALLERTK
jgi:hypothetical protein